MRTLTLTVQYHGDTGKPGLLEATFTEGMGVVSVDEAFRGIAFGVALLYKNSLKGADVEEFSKEFAKVVKDVITHCVVNQNSATLH